jgi:hypothetical protein
LGRAVAASLDVSLTLICQTFCAIGASDNDDAPLGPLSFNISTPRRLALAMLRRASPFQTWCWQRSLIRLGGAFVVT